MTTTKKHVVRIYNKGITATYMVYDKNLFKEHEFATKREAIQFIRRLELANDKRANGIKKQSKFSKHLCLQRSFK